MPCLSLIFERASVLYGSRSESRCVSRLDASIIKTGETSTMKCVLFGLFGSVSPFISLAMRCASCSILASRRASICSLRLPGASCARRCFSSCNSSCSAYGSLGSVSKRSNFPSCGSEQPSKSLSVGCSRFPRT